MRVFLDANILFSGARPDSRLRALLNLLLAHGQCLTNPYAAEEARRNLEIKDPARLKDLRSLLAKRAMITALTTGLPVVFEPKDIPILGGAVAGKATHLLTADTKHFGRYYGRTIQGVRIVSPKMLADELVAEGLL